jgi:hypothetical protein
VTGFGRKGLGEPVREPAARGGLPASVRYDVTPSPRKMLLGIGFFGAAAMVSYLELLDPRPLLINHLIELSPGGADIFFGILMLASLGMVAMACVGLVRSFGEKVFITLDNQSITGPTRYNGTHLIRIDYRAIREVKHSRIHNQEFVVISAVDQRKIKVGQTHFRTATEWEQFLFELRQRMTGG